MLEFYGVLCAVCLLNLPVLKIVFLYKLYLSKVFVDLLLYILSVAHLSNLLVG